jgi:hypothetical protein
MPEAEAMRVRVINLNRQLRDKERILATLSDSHADLGRKKLIAIAILELKLELREATQVFCTWILQIKPILLALVVPRFNDAVCLRE